MVAPSATPGRSATHACLLVGTQLSARIPVLPAWSSGCSPPGKQRHIWAAGTLDVSAGGCQWLGLGTPDGIHDLVGDVPVPECWVVGLALPADVEDELFG